MDWAQDKLVALLRWSERYTKTDMVYLASGGFWLVLEQTSGVLLALGVAVVFGHMAGQDTYGNYKFVLSLASLLSILSLSGLGEAVGQAVARGKDGALLQGMRLNLRWSGLFIFGSLTLAAYYFFWLQNPFVGGSLVIVAILQPIATSSSFFTTFLFAQKDFARGAIYTIAENIFTYGAVLVALLIGERAIMLVVAYFAANAAAALFLTWKAEQRARNQDQDEGLLRFGFHLSAMKVLAVIADKFDSIIIFSFLGPAQLAIYSFAQAAPEQIKGAVKNLYGLAFPKFAGRSLAETQKTIWPKLLILTAAISMIMAAYVIAAPVLFSYLFPIYIEAVPYSQWFAVSVIFTGFPIILSSALTAHKKTRALYIANNAAPLMLIGLLVILVPAFGIAGAIAAQIGYRGFNALVHSWQFIRAAGEE